MQNTFMIAVILLLSSWVPPQGRPSGAADQAATAVRDFLTALMKQDLDAAMKFAQPGLAPDVKTRMQQGFAAMAGGKIRIIQILEVRTEVLAERGNVPTATVFTRLEFVSLRRNEAPEIREYSWRLVKLKGHWYYNGGGL